MNKSFENLKKLALPILALSLVLGATSVFGKPDASTQKQLEAAVNGSWRTAENRARDQYRHPLQTLTFFGIKPNSTVVELIPNGKAYYTEILAPFLYEKGSLTILNIAGNPEEAGQKEKFAADPARYGKIKVSVMTPPVIDFGVAPNSVDYFLTFRNVHNFAMKDAHGDLFKNIFKVLKPGGILGIEDHRATEEKTFEEVKYSGYLPEAFVIAEAEKAGFVLAASSGINNNPKDTKDYPKGVWSLPPTLAEGDKDREKFLAIGESDRFTLRFVKPKK